jgi:hypothetical protein
MGDFNSHHPWWGPLTETTNQEAENLVDWIEKNELSLLNKQGEPTFFRLVNRPSTLDLALISESILPIVKNFCIYYEYASDHWGIQLQINPTNKETVDSRQSPCANQV